MGAWGVLAFDDDDACDWSYGLEKVSDLSLVVATFAIVKSADDYLEAPQASEALAGCEVLTRLLGHPGYQNSYTETADEWVAQHPQQPSAALLARASSVIDRILGERSELRDLWEDGDPTKWLEAVEDLRTRLQA